MREKWMRENEARAKISTLKVGLRSDQHAGATIGGAPIRPKPIRPNEKMT